MTSENKAKFPFTSLKGPPEAVSVIACPGSDSFAFMSIFNSVPASMHRSFVSSMIGGLLLQSLTLTCISRIMDPIKKPSRYSLINIAKLNSPLAFGFSHVSVPELTSTETPLGNVYP